jgi:hypothetical protein
MSLRLNRVINTPFKMQDDILMYAAVRRKRPKRLQNPETSSTARDWPDSQIGPIPE